MAQCSKFPFFLIGGDRSKVLRGDSVSHDMILNGPCSTDSFIKCPWSLSLIRSWCFEVFPDPSISRNKLCLMEMLICFFLNILGTWCAFIHLYTSRWDVHLCKAVLWTRCTFMHTSQVFHNKDCKLKKNIMQSRLQWVKYEINIGESMRDQPQGSFESICTMTTFNRDSVISFSVSILYLSRRAPLS